MRVRLTDGQHEIEIRAKGYSRRRLDDAEAAALRILDALRDTQPGEQRPPFGFAPDTSLDSSTERAEPYDDRHDDGEGEGDE